MRRNFRFPFGHLCDLITIHQTRKFTKKSVTPSLSSHFLRAITRNHQIGELQDGTYGEGGHAQEQARILNAWPFTRI